MNGQQVIVAESRLFQARHHGLLSQEDQMSEDYLDIEEWDRSIQSMAAMVASAAVPMALIIGYRRILFGNSRAERLLTETIGAVSGCSLLDPELRRSSLLNAILKRAFSGRTVLLPSAKVTVINNGEARLRWFSIHLTPIVGSGGEIRAVLGVAHDITAMKEKIERLSDSEQRLRLALESSGMVGIWTLDVASRTSTADASVARIYGLSAEACAKGVDDCLFIQAIHPDDRDRVEVTLSDAISTARPYRSRYRITAADGHVRWVITSAKPVVDHAGHVRRLLGVVVEITDQVETASALAESRFQFQTLTEALPQIVWSCDSSGRHDYFSERWSEFTGIGPDEITEDTWKRLVYPQHQDMVASVWGNALRTGETYDIDYRFRHHSGEYRWLRVMALPVRDKSGQIIRWFGTSTDVHDSYMVTEEREQLARELQRLATEDQLTGMLTRRAFIDETSTFLTESCSLNTEASMLMLDIDHFKSINDTYGHPAGDQVIAAVANRIRASVRTGDLTGRLGGEEFCIFLPECSRAQASEIAERIRRAVCDHPISTSDGGEIEVTVSIGAAQLHGQAPSFDEIVGAADRALYRAKANGRNRVQFAS